ncbi:hypothetical protein BDR06DRAFT_305551 [Suillus hirtellus]|nr:hypothetical protein BDR06DRAFT_305551 [Suillus hirtellus]
MQIVSLHLPTVHQPSRPIPIHGSGVHKVISSSDGRLKLKPMPAEGVQAQRYKPGNGNIIQRDIRNFNIPHMMIDPIEISAPPGWQAYIHPEGRLYYCYESVVAFDGCSKTLHVITQADLVRDGVAETIEDLAKLAYSHASQYSSFPANVDLVLEPKDVGETIIGEYYFVHHKNRCLFWLLDFDAVDILRECSGVTELAHKKIELEAQYWYALQQFSRHGDCSRK